MKGETCKKEKWQIPSERGLFVLEVDEDGRIEKLTLEEGQICLEGFRQLNGKLVRGVPKKSLKDCVKYCRHEGCDFL